ncbi:hypothetical protein sscle_09g073790 [Sclerotinia sclerotiorum 1980 UF-70]|uniref:Sugar phosphate transporter domain-containing protein n=1 Tax=Sclerotinia sclerotiorum (strain ATCC 18683 / 1980 / Ss-1) TaxID=665079 RepID=A0A1D9QCK2_SCLS1|nr:hypothetical protein sscle_09g073790 [Sclerotinia sclerotiorum 1980 UF-70]
MARRRRADSAGGTQQQIPMTIPRRRSTLRELQASNNETDVVAPKVINAAPSLEKAEMYGINDKRSRTSKILAVTGRIFIETIPQWLAVGVMLGLIFGGCCSNVFALEAIVKVEPDSGTLMTFVQFFFVAVTGYISQFDRSRPPLFLTPNRVPLQYIRANAHYFTFWRQIQVIAVTLLTIGVVTAAWSDAQSKNGEVDEDIPSFNTGLIILFIAQVLSAIMGLYTEETYKEYGPHWKENLFYSHLLALPLFAPFLPSMHRQLLKLASSTPLTLPILESLQSLPSDLLTKLSHIYLPSQLVFLAMNVLTQYACIRGVNLLAAASSALTVTIVLNVRKLISLLLSIWLFGNRLSPGTLVGACLVFFAGGLYSLDGGKKKGANRHKSTSNGKVG